MHRFAQPIRLALILIATAGFGAYGGESGVEIERLSRAGLTVDLDRAAPFPLPDQRLRNDTGINVLVDLAHTCNFYTLWNLPRELNACGFRASGSQTTLDHSLVPKTPVRVRIPVGSRRPFAWWPNADWNVVITYQSGPDAQQYLDEEKEALQQFLASGGGLVVLAPGRIYGRDKIAQWPLNELARQYGGAFSAKADRIGERRVPTLDIGVTWETVLAGDAGMPLIARRKLGGGRVVLVSTPDPIHFDSKRDAQTERTEKQERLSELVTWAAGERKPVGGSRRLPTPAAGGGGIYPESEMRVGNIVVYYAKNQKQELIDTVTNDLPAVREQIEAWLPSPPPTDPMYLILCAGAGGGWAVNAYEPKEVGIISLSPDGIVSIFAHELAHTMSGPVNDSGSSAAQWAHGNQGESHAGWFQGKIMVQRTGVQPVKNLNRLFDVDQGAAQMDLAMESDAFRDQWGKGKDWLKIWWVWQKLDDRYGPTWYPRWRWVQSTRWRDRPDRRLTWDETVEDMSIAVGEDLFPFFRRIGTSLKKDRFPQALFRGQQIELPIAPLEISPGGDAKLGPIGDFTQPISSISTE